MRLETKSALGVRPSRSRRLAGQCLSTILGVALLGVAGRRPLDGAEQGTGTCVNGHSFRIPAGDGRLVHGLSEEGPKPVLQFREAYGLGWRLYWDHALDTLRFLAPTEPVAIAEPEVLDQDLEALIAGVKGFLNGISDLLGVDPSCLGEPRVYPVVSRYVVVFPQVTPGGIPVRGAAVRVVLGGEGDLRWVKAFTFRGARDPQGVLLDRDQVVTAALLPGETVLTSRLEMAWQPSDPVASIPIWSLDIVGDGGQHYEGIVDARRGEVLARRQVVKEFFARGMVLGRAPAPDDSFSSPQSGNAVLSSLRGLVIRDIRRKEIGFTSPDGTFEVETESNPVTLSVALEQGYLDVSASDPRRDEHGYAPLLQIAPLDSMLRPWALGPDEDMDGDGVPDIVLSGSVGEDLIGVFNKGAGEGSDERAWWLQCYSQASKMLSGMEVELEAFGLARFYLPWSPLRIQPTTFEGLQLYTAPNPGAAGFATILSSTTMKVGESADGGWLLENVVPTQLLHEVGHHIFGHMTNYGDVELKGIEEGVADVLVGLTTGHPEIGYKEGHRPTPLGFCLGTEDGHRDPGRADVGNGFWILRNLLFRDFDPDSNAQSPTDVVAGLLLHWLALHRVVDRSQLIFDLSDHLLDELLDVDACLYGPRGVILPDRLHTQAILDAFRGRRFFDAPFVRGDSNLDQTVNLSDAVATLSFLFGGTGPNHECKNAMDADNNGEIDLSDAVFLLKHLFLGGAILPPPYPDCGLDPEAPGTPGNLGCVDFTCPR